MSRQFECPWTHTVLAGLAGAFMLVASVQVFSGAGQVYWAHRTARQVIERDRDGLANLLSSDELAVKRSIQAAYRQGGLYVPLEDVILDHQGRASVWLAVPFRIPWAGTFVNGISREFNLSGSTGRIQ